MAHHDTGETDVLMQALVDVAVESWRFSRGVARLLLKLDASEQARHVSQLRYFQKRLDECLESAELKLVSIEGLPFDPGMAATALNLGDFSPEDKLLVDQQLEPIIMGRDGLVRGGTVTLRKVD